MAGCSPLRLGISPNSTCGKTGRPHRRRWLLNTKSKSRPTALTEAKKPRAQFSSRAFDVLGRGNTSTHQPALSSFGEAQHARWVLSSRRETSFTNRLGETEHPGLKKFTKPSSTNCERVPLQHPVTTTMTATMTTHNRTSTLLSKRTPRRQEVKTIRATARPRDAP